MYEPIDLSEDRISSDLQWEWVICPRSGQANPKHLVWHGYLNQNLDHFNKSYIHRITLDYQFPSFSTSQVVCDGKFLYFLGNERLYQYDITINPPKRQKEIPIPNAYSLELLYPWLCIATPNDIIMYMIGQLEEISNRFSVESSPDFPIHVNQRKKTLIYFKRTYQQHHYECIMYAHGIDHQQSKTIKVVTEIPSIPVSNSIHLFLLCFIQDRVSLLYYEFETGIVTKQFIQQHYIGRESALFILNEQLYMCGTDHEIYRIDLGHPLRLTQVGHIFDKHPQLRPQAITLQDHIPGTLGLVKEHIANSPFICQGFINHSTISFYDLKANELH